MSEKHGQTLEEEVIADVAHGWKPFMHPLTDVGGLDQTVGLGVSDVVQGCKSKNLSKVTVNSTSLKPGKVARADDTERRRLLLGAYLLSEFKWQASEDVSLG